jgi:hypothetical protein
MSKQRKQDHQRQIHAPKHASLPPALHPLTNDWLAERADRPDSVIIVCHVRVLLKGDWHLLYQVLEQASIEAPDLTTVDRLITHAVLALAARSLAVHIDHHQSLYRQAGLTELHIGLPDERLLLASTVWGDTETASLFAELQSAVENASRARALNSGIPTNVFWPVVGGFYCEPDKRPEPSSATWSDVTTHPKRYALVPLRVTARLAIVYGSQGKEDLWSARREVSDWWLCRRCGRCYQDGERRIVTGRVMCPYIDCHGEVGRDALTWEYIRARNPLLPKVPGTGIVYPL